MMILSFKLYPLSIIELLSFSKSRENVKKSSPLRVEMRESLNTYSKGIETTQIISELSDLNIKLNVTAIFTIEQIQK